MENSLVFSLFRYISCRYFVMNCDLSTHSILLAVLLAKKVFLILINVSSMGSDCSVVFETLLPCV